MLHQDNKTFGIKKTLLPNITVGSPGASHFSSLSFSSLMDKVGFWVKTSDDVYQAPRKGLSHRWRCCMNGGLFTQCDHISKHGFTDFPWKVLKCAIHFMRTDSHDVSFMNLGFQVEQDRWRPPVNQNVAFQCSGPLHLARRTKPSFTHGQGLVPVSRRLNSLGPHFELFGSTELTWV